MPKKRVSESRISKKFTKGSKLNDRTKKKSTNKTRSKTRSKISNRKNSKKMKGGYPDEEETFEGFPYPPPHNPPPHNPPEISVNINLKNKLDRISDKLEILENTLTSVNTDNNYTLELYYNQSSKFIFAVIKKPNNSTTTYKLNFNGNLLKFTQTTEFVDYNKNLKIDQIHIHIIKMPSNQYFNFTVYDIEEEHITKSSEDTELKNVISFKTTNGDIIRFYTENSKSGIFYCPTNTGQSDPRIFGKEYSKIIAEETTNKPKKKKKEKAGEKAGEKTPEQIIKYQGKISKDRFISLYFKDKFYKIDSQDGINEYDQIVINDSTINTINQILIDNELPEEFNPEKVKLTYSPKSDSGNYSTKLYEDLRQQMAQIAPVNKVNGIEEFEVYFYQRKILIHIKNKVQLKPNDKFYELKWNGNSFDFDERRVPSDRNKLIQCSNIFMYSNTVEEEFDPTYGAPGQTETQTFIYFGITTTSTTSTLKLFKVLKDSNSDNSNSDNINFMQGIVFNPSAMFENNPIKTLFWKKETANDGINKITFSEFDGYKETADSATGSSPKLELYKTNEIIKKIIGFLKIKTEESVGPNQGSRQRGRQRGRQTELRASTNPPRRPTAQKPNF